MKTRLIIDGNAVYEIDEECEACRNGTENFLEEKKKLEQEEKQKDSPS